MKMAKTAFSARRLLAACLAAVLSLSAEAVWPSHPGSCRITAEQGGYAFPVERLDADQSCRLGAVVNHSTTTGNVGPLRSLISPPLYEFLLDRPVLTAALVRRLGLGSYEFTARGPDQYWGNDGDGTQGLLSLVQRNGSTRIYHIDGYHEGHVFPMVKAQAVVFVKILPAASANGAAAVDTSLTAYTRLNDPVLSGLVWMLRPLVGETVTQKLALAFEVTTKVGNAIAEDAARILREAAGLPFTDPEERQSFTARLQELIQRRGAPSAPRPTP